MTARGFKYDAALSFAGEDRKLAESLFRSLSERGFSVFYDADREAHLWGKTSREFETIYGPQSRYVIPIISKYYVQKDWTQFEFDTARREQRKRRTEFILPIRVDQTPLLGLPDSIIRQDGSSKSAEQIAEVFAAKCRPQRIRTASPRLSRGRTLPLSLLRKDARQALGLIASAAVPLPRAYFSKLFPQYNWRNHFEQFQRAGFLQKGSLLLKLNEATLKVLNEDVENRACSNQLWIDRLSKLDAHVDTAALLSVNLVSAKRFEEAARVSLNIAQSSGLGWWNHIYITILSGLADQRIFAKLTRQTRIEMLNSLGTCLTQAGRYAEALARFLELRRLSRRYRNSWGIGQSFINAGVASSKAGNNRAAIDLYSKAVDHGKRSRDRTLQGRALSNMSQLYLAEDIDRAERLLEESLKIKAAVDDFTGLVVGTALRGNLAAMKKQFLVAASWYRQAARAASTVGLVYEQALSTYNLGRALQDAGRATSAVRSYKRAIELARPADYTDILQLSLIALGAIAFAQRAFKESYQISHDLLEVSRRTKNSEYEISAVHMSAVSSLALGRGTESKREFGAALRLAREHDSSQWIVRCHVDSCRGPEKNGLGGPSTVRLRQIAKAEAACRQNCIAGEIWGLLARMYAATKADGDACEAFSTAEKYLSRSSTASPRLNLYRSWFGWAWGARRYRAAIQALVKLERLGYKSHNKADATAAMDQRGVCLQELGRYREAEPLHRAAVIAARRMKDEKQEENSLNNLGEALRQLDRPLEAINAFTEAEEIARRNQRYDAAISVAHNRALALEALGKVIPSARLLQKCRDEAAHRKIWSEYVRALEALANVAWTRDKVTIATRLYRQAQRASRKHQVTEIAPRIALNLARILRVQNKPKEALQILQPLRSEFDHSVGSFVYFGTLAQVYEETGKIQDAASTWTLAKTRAAMAGNSEYESRSASNANRLLGELQKPRVSEHTLARALKSENNPARRADLLIQQLRLLIQQRSQRRAQLVFDQALLLCSENRLRKTKTDLYLLVGDSELSPKYTAQLNAFKAYFMAMISAFEQNISRFETVVSHVILKIASATSPIRDGEMRRLVKDLRAEVVKGKPTASSAAETLLWPFKIAAEIFPLRRKPRQFAAAIEQLTKSVPTHLKHHGE